MKGGRRFAEREQGHETDSTSRSYGIYRLEDQQLKNIDGSNRGLYAGFQARTWRFRHLPNVSKARTPKPVGGEQSAVSLGRIVRMAIPADPEVPPPMQLRGRGRAMRTCPGKAL